MGLRHPALEPVVPVQQVVVELMALLLEGELVVEPRLEVRAEVDADALVADLEALGIVLPEVADGHGAAIRVLRDQSTHHAPFGSVIAEDELLVEALPDPGPAGLQLQRVTLDQGRPPARAARDGHLIRQALDVREPRLEVVEEGVMHPQVRRSPVGLDALLDAEGLVPRLVGEVPHGLDDRAHGAVFFDLHLSLTQGGAIGRAGLVNQRRGTAHPRRQEALVASCQGHDLTVSINGEAQGARVHEHLISLSLCHRLRYQLASDLPPELQRVLGLSARGHVGQQAHEHPLHAAVGPVAGRRHLRRELLPVAHQPHVAGVAQHAAREGDAAGDRPALRRRVVRVADGQRNGGDAGPGRRSFCWLGGEGDIGPVVCRAIGPRANPSAMVGHACLKARQPRPVHQPRALLRGSLPVVRGLPVLEPGGRRPGRGPGQTDLLFGPHGHRPPRVLDAVLDGAGGRGLGHKEQVADAVLATRSRRLQGDDVACLQVARLAQVVEPGAVVVTVRDHNAGQFVIHPDDDAFIGAIVVHHEAHVVPARAWRGGRDAPALALHLHVREAARGERVHDEAVALKLVVAHLKVRFIAQHRPQEVQPERARDVMTLRVVARAHDLLPIRHRYALDERVTY